jgi:hypothetical protein
MAIERLVERDWVLEDIGDLHAFRSLETFFDTGSTVTFYSDYDWHVWTECMNICMYVSFIATIGTTPIPV